MRFVELLRFVSVDWSGYVVCLWGWFHCFSFVVGSFSSLLISAVVWVFCWVTCVVWIGCLHGVVLLLVGVVGC